ncbi:hypothetical protein RYX36_009218, partial [Vicia faba]
MGEEVVCLQALEDGRTKNNEVQKAELKRNYHQCVADTEPPDVSPNKKQSKEKPDSPNRPRGLIQVFPGEPRILEFVERT